MSGGLPSLLSGTQVILTQSSNAIKYSFAKESALSGDSAIQGDSFLFQNRIILKKELSNCNQIQLNVLLLVVAISE